MPRRWLLEPGQVRRQPSEPAAFLFSYEDRVRYLLEVQVPSHDLCSSAPRRGEDETVREACLQTRSQPSRLDRDLLVYGYQETFLLQRFSFLLGLLFTIVAKNPEVVSVRFIVDPKAISDPSMNLAAWPSMDLPSSILSTTSNQSKTVMFFSNKRLQLRQTAQFRPLQGLALLQDLPESIRVALQILLSLQLLKASSLCPHPPEL